MINSYLAKFSSFGSYYPKRIVNNFDLEKLVDTTDQWIRERTGMFERRFAADDEASSDLAYKAAEMAIMNSSVRAKDIEMIIVGTISPDYMFPSTACLVQTKLGLKDIPAFDLSAGCTGFIYACNVAKQFIENGVYKNILVIGVEILTRLINWQDRGTCVLFGDGAGAAIISRAEPTDISRIIDTHFTADGALADLLVQKGGGSRMPASQKTIDENLHTVYMEGNKIFRQAVRSMQDSCELLLKRNDISIKDIDWIISHQANLRIIEALGEKLKVDKDKVIVTIHKYANTSSASVPMAMTDALKEGKVRRGDIVLLTAFGAGLTTGSILLRY